MSTEEAVIAPIKQLFDAMRAGDSAMLLSTFFSNAVLQTVIKDKEGIVRVRSENIADFARQVGTPHEEIYDEKIWSYEVKTDGPLAAVWTEYSFYLGEKFSHCGVNSFQLIQTEEGWKILSIIDTRRTEDCRKE